MNKDDNKVEQTNKQAIATTTKNVKTELAVKEITSFQQAEALVDFIAESPVFNGKFKESVTDEDGNQQMVVNRNAIMTCLLLGNELGFTPMVAVTFGKSLNREAAIKVERGKAMGLNPMAAMQNIYVFNTSQMEIVYTGIHVVNKVLTDAGVKREIIEDGTKPYYIYKYCKADLRNEIVLYDETTKDQYVVINDGHSESWVDDQVKNNGKIPIYRTATRRALVKLTRGNEVVAIPYTLQQAVDAGLYPGIKSDGTESKGKANWIAHPETHLIKMSIMLGGRIIASDKLNGIYVDSELPQVIKLTKEEIEDTPYTECEEL